MIKPVNLHTQPFVYENTAVYLDSQQYHNPSHFVDEARFRPKSKIPTMGGQWDDTNVVKKVAEKAKDAKNFFDDQFNKMLSKICKRRKVEKGYWSNKKEKLLLEFKQFHSALYHKNKHVIRSKVYELE